MCLSNEEIVDHLLFNCKMAKIIWSSVLSCFDCDYVSSRTLLDHFEAYKMASRSFRGKLMWRALLLEVIWAIRKARNRRCFDKKFSMTEGIAYTARFSVATWVSTHPLFHGLSMELIQWKWREIIGNSFRVFLSGSVMFCFFVRRLLFCPGMLVSSYHLYC